MAKIKPEKAKAKEIFDGFNGLEAQKTGHAVSAADIRNFRILADGSLQKRCGIRTHMMLTDTARAFWKGNLGGREQSFAVAGKYIYRIESFSQKLINTLETETGRIQFLHYGDFLYLLTGTQILVYRGSTACFEEAKGYAPLYGYNWHPLNYGDIYEPLNLLSRRLRVHYLNTTGSTVFSLPFYAASIDEVRLDGTVSANYTLLSSKREISLTEESNIPSSVEVAFTMELDTDIRQELLQCTSAFSARDDEAERLILFGSPRGNLLFCANLADESMKSASKAIYSDSDPLYFSTQNIIAPSDSNHPVTTLCLQQNRILVFSSNSTYSLRFAEKSNTVEGYPLLCGIGCTAHNLQLYLDGDPIILNAGGIFRLHSSASTPNEITLTSISDEMDMFRQSDFYENAIACEDISHGELWFAAPNDTEGRIWIYNTAHKKWYCFDNIAPAFFFYYESTPLFGRNTDICAFDEALSEDQGLPFSASYQTDYLTFSYPEDQKRALRLTLCASVQGEETTLLVETERNAKTLCLPKAEQSTPCLFDSRVPIGRFRFVRVRLTDSGSKRSHFFRLALFANL